MSLLCSPLCWLRIKATFLFPSNLYFFIWLQWAEEAKILAGNKPMDEKAKIFLCPRSNTVRNTVHILPDLVSMYTCSINTQKCIILCSKPLRSQTTLLKHRSLHILPYHGQGPFLSLSYCLYLKPPASHQLFF